MNEFGVIDDIVLKHARDAFVGPSRIAAEWHDLNFTAAPDFARAIDEYDRFADLIAQTGATVRWLPAGSRRRPRFDLCAGRGDCQPGRPDSVSAWGSRSARESRRPSGTPSRWDLPVAGAIQSAGPARRRRRRLARCGDGGRRDAAIGPTMKASGSSARFSATRWSAQRRRCRTGAARATSSI